MRDRNLGFRGFLKVVKEVAGERANWRTKFTSDQSALLSVVNQSRHSDLQWTKRPLDSRIVDERLFLTWTKRWWDSEMSERQNAERVEHTVRLHACLNRSEDSALPDFEKKNNWKSNVVGNVCNELTFPLLWITFFKAGLQLVKWAIMNCHDSLCD